MLMCACDIISRRGKKKEGREKEIKSVKLMFLEQLYCFGSTWAVNEEMEEKRSKWGRENLKSIKNRIRMGNSFGLNPSGNDSKSLLLLILSSLSLLASERREKKGDARKKSSFPTFKRTFLYVMHFLFFLFCRHLSTHNFFVLFKNSTLSDFNSFSPSLFWFLPLTNLLLSFADSKIRFRGLVETFKKQFPDLEVDIQSELERYKVRHTHTNQCHN